MVARKKDLRELGQFTCRYTRDLAICYNRHPTFDRMIIYRYKFFAPIFVYTLFILVCVSFALIIEQSVCSGMHNQTCLQQWNFRVSLNYFDLNHIHPEHFMMLWCKFSGNRQHKNINWYINLTILVNRKKAFISYRQKE